MLPLAAWKRAILHALVQGWLGGALNRPWILRRIARDPIWSAEYNALRHIERLASGRALGTAQREQIESRLFAALPKILPDTKPTSVAAPAFALSAAAAAAITFFAVQAPVAPPTGDNSSNPEVPTWTARGAQARAVGARLRCLDTTSQAIVDDAETGPRADVDVLRCRRGDALAMSFTNLTSQEAYALVVGIGADGGVRILPPFSADGGAVSIPAGAVEEVLPMLADTTGLPDEARTSLFVAFADKPMPVESILQLIRDANARGLPLQALEHLPLPAGVQQGRVDVRWER